MLQPPFSFDDIMAPIGADAFMSEYEGKKPLHLKGAADKFMNVMSWSLLNDLLGQATIWSQQSLMLVLDKETLPAQKYCAPAAGRDGGQVLRPDPARVQDYLKKGATLVANDIDHLSAGLTAFSRCMEQALGAKIQGNLYCSSKRRQGFAAHFDTHDVYAVHVEGTKTWHIYEGRATDPIAHPMFKTLGREHHEKAKGKLLMDVVMEPGDLLYLPRGQYHDALADQGGAVHIAFGATYPIGMDVMSMLFDQVVAEPVFRANLPRPDEGDTEQRLARLAEVIGSILKDPKTAAAVAAFQNGFFYPRHGYDLPALLETPVEPAYSVHAKDIKLIEQGGRYGLVKAGSRNAVEVPAEISDMVDWVLKRQQFSRGELAITFPDRSAQALDKLLTDLATMHLIEAL
ncbi:MAG: cupin domain-containing protein [Alphaproteobacteria bacterium]|nr:cupin domain-containing protein [Alphaproteobacteria bacterium]